MTPRPVRLSKAVLRALDRVGGEKIVVAAVKTITRENVSNYSAFGVGFRDGKVTVSDPAPPPPSSGPWARRNLDGWSDKRRDLPKETRSISHLAPSWHGSGTHLVSRSVEAYPVEHHDARMLTVSATALEDLRDGALVRFRVDQPIDRTSPDYTADLQFNLRLLREAIGTANIFDADLSDEEFASIQQVDWELLPPGSLARVLAMLASKDSVDPRKREVASERLEQLATLDYTNLIVGRGRFSNYFGARFGGRLVALESLEYGNALYVFEDDWEALSQLSRTELMKRRDPSVHRIPHVHGWQSTLRNILRIGL